MRNYQTLVCLFCIFFCSIELRAQDFRVTPLEVNENFPSLTINRTFQDQNGFIWFATQRGICRFDGANMLTFSPEKILGDSLVSDNVLSINEVGNILLVGTDRPIGQRDYPFLLNMFIY